jgi:hypothetical protein
MGEGADGPRSRQHDICEVCDVLFRPGFDVRVFYACSAMTGAWKEPGRPQRLVPGAQARWPGHGRIELAGHLRWCGAGAPGGAS